MKDLYKILGVDRNADPDTIKRAYRKLASLYHPDKEGGSKTKFQELEEAYRILSDPQKRQQYDNPSPFGQFGQGGNPGFSSYETPFDLDSIFSMFGARFNHPQQMRRAQMTLWITLLDVAKGGPRTVTVGTQQGTHAVEIEIPLGIDDGDSVQYGGIGPGGMDLIVTYRIHPNPRFQRNRLNLITDHQVNLWDLILGSTAEVKDVLGKTLELTVPARTQPGTVLRLRGQGLADRQGNQGDLLVRIQAQIPEEIPESLLAEIEKNRTA